MASLLSNYSASPNILSAGSFCGLLDFNFYDRTWFKLSDTVRIDESFAEVDIGSAIVGGNMTPVAALLCILADVFDCTLFDGIWRGKSIA